MTSCPVETDFAPTVAAWASSIAFPRRSDWEPELSKRQLADRLGYSTRWVELRVREGMPTSSIKGNQRRFLLSEVETWLAQRRKSA
ncbi:helix-turn-helix transcriptional regulator [Capillimicrobium parvum]|uniref:Helix-turn-helix domain-containing protein n=1 Tax=Capillimicrobium parvum TaxID=2884022 RepID=A0A9E7C0L0_9ACTN|nr:helix-turn-helix domain-containing protein [Capillimicrobium parvum]UGS35503.1 hypothetical protein DSM104329_01896 [Capillimicrobium parvum]